MRKTIATVTSLLLAGSMALSLAACTGPAEPSAPSADSQPAAASSEETGGTSTAEEKVQLTFSWWGGDERHETTEKAIQAFMEKYPHIVVTPEYGAWNGWEEKQSLNIVGGNGADVMQVNWNWIESYSGNGTNFVNLEEYADVLDLSQFPDSALELCKADGKLMAVPVAMTGRVFYWNKTTFDEIGCPIPTDLESLLAAGAAFEAYGEDYYPMDLNQYDRMIFMVYYLESRYNKPWVENNKIQYTKEEIQEGLEFITGLEEAHVLPTLATVAGDMADSTDKNSKWIDGKYCGIFEWDSSANKFRQALEQSVNKPGQEFVLGEFVKMGDYQGGFTKISMGLAVSSTSKHPKEAAMLINFLLNEQEGVEISSTTRGIPCSKTAVQILNEKNLGDSMVREANEKVLAYCPFPVDSKFEHNDLKANPDGVYFKVFGRLSSGDLTSAEAADELIAGITECLEN